MSIVKGWQCKTCNGFWVGDADMQRVSQYKCDLCGEIQENMRAFDMVEVDRATKEKRAVYPIIDICDHCAEQVTFNLDILVGRPRNVY